jgi:integrase
MAGHVRKRHRATCASRKDASRRCSCDGPWRARYPKPNGIGTAQIERTFATKRDAEHWLTAQAASISHGTHIAPRAGARPLSEIYDAWRETRWPGLEPKTTARYAQVWRTHLEPEFANLKVGEISREHVSRYFARLSRDGLRPGTVRKIHSVLSGVLAEAVELGYVRANPCAGMKGLPRVERREMLFLERDEVRMLADAINPNYRALVWTASLTGLRAGELLALRWKNVDLLHGRLTVTQALKDVDGHLVFGPTKTHEVRTISLPRFLVGILQDHLTSATVGTGPEALVFAGPQGGPIRHNAFVRRNFKPAVRRVLPHKAGLRFHDLRHTAASLAIAAGAHPKQIQEMLGHSSITTTLDRYGHLSATAHEALAAKLDELFAAAFN